MQPPHVADWDISVTPVQVVLQCSAHIFCRRKYYFTGLFLCPHPETSGVANVAHRQLQEAYSGCSMEQSAQSILGDAGLVGVDFTQSSLMSPCSGTDGLESPLDALCMPCRCSLPRSFGRSWNPAFFLSSSLCLVISYSQKPKSTANNEICLFL